VSTPDFLVCQYCGYSMEAFNPDALHWLVSPHRASEGLWVIRCPAHISEWAMRESKAGRTNANREKARWGREVWAQQLLPPSSVMPIPASFQGAQEASEPPESTEAENGPVRPSQTVLRADR